MAGMRRTVLKNVQKTCMVIFVTWFVFLIAKHPVIMYMAVKVYFYSIDNFKIKLLNTIECILITFCVQIQAFWYFFFYIIISYNGYGWLESYQFFNKYVSKVFEIVYWKTDHLYSISHVVSLPDSLSISFTSNDI